MTSLTDQQLLRDYTAHHSDVAFAELVRRHVDFVYSAALRMVRDAHLAEDVTQGVFVAFAQNARQLSDRPVLSGWLHRTAQNLAANAVRSDVRRRAREQEAAAMNELLSSDPDAVWEHIAPHLDAALGVLSDADRDVLLLRYFERKSAQEMAQTLGISDDAAQKRVSRAIERLREFFAERGITIGASGLVVVISAHAVQAAPVGLAITISTAAALAGTTIVAATTATATQAIVMTTLQKTLLAAALVIAVIAPLYWQHRAIQNLRAENTRARELAAAASREATPSPALTPADAAELERLRREHDELLRLRGEVSRLRQQLTAAVPKRLAPSAPAAAAKEAEQPPEPVQIFVANADANVPAGQTLAFGGWATSPGKRMLVFVQPKILELSSPGRAGQVFLQGSFIEVPEGVLAKMAVDLNLDVLENLKTAGRASSTQNVLTAEQTTLVLQTLEQSAGVNVLTAPRVSTGDGRQAIISVTEQKMVAGQEHTLGPSLDVEPRIAADGSSVNLTVSARLRQANPAQ